MSHIMMLWQQVVEERTDDQQEAVWLHAENDHERCNVYFETTDEERGGQKELHCVFDDLEKAYDRVPREELYHEEVRS